MIEGLDLGVLDAQAAQWWDGLQQERSQRRKRASVRYGAGLGFVLGAVLGFLFSSENMPFAFVGVSLLTSGAGYGVGRVVGSRLNKSPLASPPAGELRALFMEHRTEQLRDELLGPESALARATERARSLQAEAARLSAAGTLIEVSTQEMRTALETVGEQTTGHRERATAVREALEARHRSFEDRLESLGHLRGRLREVSELEAHLGQVKALSDSLEGIEETDDQSAAEMELGGNPEIQELERLVALQIESKGIELATEATVGEFAADLLILEGLVSEFSPRE